MSLRAFAGMRGIQPSSVTRYLNGAVLPPEDFVDDLIDSATHQSGRPLPEAAEKMRQLLHAAQDAQTGTWGHAKRWQRIAEQTRKLAAAMESENQVLIRENSALRELLQRNALKLGGVAEKPDFFPADLGGRRSYWRAYTQQLASRGWGTSIEALDRTTDNIVEQLASPLAEVPTSSAGEVRSLPGSGRTAVTVGVVAKAIDLGYRLIIVLGGTANVLRRQIQQSLDEGLPALPDTPGIIRLTDVEFDYRRLKQHIHSLEFEKWHPDQRLNTAENLRGSSARLIVVKKNAATLRHLFTDLKAVRTPLQEIPALVIDWVEFGNFNPESQISQLVAKLLISLPRVQYVRFVDGSGTRDDKPDIMPDFSVTLPIPKEYVRAGVQFFRDSGDVLPPNRGDLQSTAVQAHVRRVDRGESGLLAALDMFVLTAAMKVYRASGNERFFRRHILLVYTGSLLAKQVELRAQLFELWQSAAYPTAAGRRRLRRTFEDDLRAVSLAHSNGMSVPESFDDLLPDLATALEKIGADPITGSAGTPHDHIWRVVVTGVKSAETMNGYGVTLLYVDSGAILRPLPRLMDQWFGYSVGYQDMVRLYIPWPNDPATEADMHETLKELWCEGE